MKWKKAGRIFDPSAHEQPLGCREFAQSPQAIILDGRVRVVFSTRNRDATGQFLSQVACVDLSPDLSRILDVPKTPVIRLGDIGTFDEHGIFPLSPTQADGRILGYTSGWSRRVSVPVETSIGLCESFDGGRTFVRLGPGPVLTASPREPFLICDGLVRKFGGLFHMWYIFGQRWLPAAGAEPVARVYKIAHAVSRDGVEWRKEEGRAIIPDVLNADECQALPSVLELHGRYHMVFCFRHATDFRKNPARAYRLGYAWSNDLSTWHRDDDALGISPGTGDWDGEMMCYPHLCSSEGRVFLLYNGNEFGRHGFGYAELVGT